MVIADRAIRPVPEYADTAQTLSCQARIGRSERFRTQRMAAPVETFPVSNTAISLSSVEFERIKAQVIYLDAELAGLLVQPLVYATVVNADNKPLG